MKFVDRILAEPMWRHICFAEADAGEAAGAPPPAAEPEAEELDLDPEPEPTEAEEAELEIGAAKYKVPKPIKEGWDGLQKKVQETVEGTKAERLTIQAEREKATSFLKLAHTVADEIADLKSIDKQLQPYLQLTPADWMAWSQQDNEAASKALTAVNALRLQRGQLDEAIKGKIAQVQAEETKAQTEARTKAEAEVAARIKDWSPAKREALEKTATSYAGITKELFDSVVHIPGALEIIQDAMTLRDARARAKAKSATAEPAPPPEPAPKVRANGGGSSNTGLGDNVPPEQWNKNFLKMRRGG